MKNKPTIKKYYYTFTDANHCERVKLWTPKQAKEAVNSKHAFNLKKLG